MNSSVDLIGWILSHTESLKLSVKAFQAAELTNRGVFDCKVSLNLGGRSMEGRGTGTSEEVAFLKAFCEAVDRTVFVESKSQESTNGFAVHYDLSKAVEISRCELIERDKFFCHYLTKSHFFRPSISLEQAGFSNELFAFLGDGGFDFQLAEMRRSEDVFSFIFMIHGLGASKPMGFMFGMGCRPNPVEAAQSAVFEGLRHVVGNINSPIISSLDESRFLNLSKWTPESHLSLANNLEYASKLVEWIFDLNDHTKNVPEPEILNEVEFERMKLPEELDGAPLFAIRSLASRKVQDIYFGPSFKDKINFARLSNFCGREVKWEMLNHTPHPMG